MGNKKTLFLQSKVVKNSIWLLILQVFNTVIPLITLPYITRVLGSSEYGVFSLALNWVTYFQVLVEYGFGFTGAKKVSVNNNLDLQELYSRIITARIVLMLLSFFLITGISFATRTSKEQYTCMCILFIVIVGVAFQLTWLFQGKQNMRVITIINAVARTTSVLLVFLIVKSPKHLFLYCACYSTTFIFSAGAGLLYAKKEYGLKIKLCSIKDAFSEIIDGWYLFISQAMAKVFSGIGITVLGAVAASNVVGIYSALYKIPLVLILFFTPISQALYPHISVRFADSFESGRNTVKKTASYVVAIFAILGIIIILLRDKVIHIAFGADYLGYSVIVIPLTVWMILSILNNFLGIQYLVASDNQKRYSIAFTKGMIITVAANIILGIMYSIYGVAVAAPVGEMALTVFLILSIRNAEKDNKMIS